MQIQPIPLLHDNYAYLLRQEQQAIIIDPSEAAPLLPHLKNLSLQACYCTHHHFDHVGGVLELQAPEVVGSRYDLPLQRIPGQTRGVSEGDILEFEGISIHILDLPAHTLGAIAYLVEGNLFCGDTLFLMGCGRLFEGTPALLLKAMQKLRSLPPETRIWCGHEYTAKNQRFSQQIEPSNRAIRSRPVDIPSIPGTIAQECATNPFFRWDTPEVRAWAFQQGAEDSAESILSALRLARNQF